MEEHSTPREQEISQWAASPRRVFVTGALGFIGRALAERYRAHGADVRGVDATGDAALGVVAGDVSCAGSWQSAAAGAELVIHTAAIVNNTEARARCWEVNVLGTRRALDAAVAVGAARFVHFSSVRAFSDTQFPDGVEESYPVRPDGHRYVDTKIASEQVALQAHAAGEIDVTVVRPGDVYGPESKPWTLLPVRAIAQDRFFLPSGGPWTFSPVYVDNLVDGVVEAARTPGAAGQVLTISDGLGVPNERFFGHYFRMLRKPIRRLPPWLLRVLFATSEWNDRLRQRPVLVNAETVDYLLRTGTYSNRKARALLGWKPRVTLEEGMERTEEWLRARAPRAAMSGCRLEARARSHPW